ncbi:unnamed protein product, partial [Owenia fusiformis]
RHRRRSSTHTINESDNITVKKSESNGRRLSFNDILANEHGSLPKFTRSISSTCTGSRDTSRATTPMSTPSPTISITAPFEGFQNTRTLTRRNSFSQDIKSFNVFVKVLLVAIFLSVGLGVYFKLRKIDFMY